MADLCLKSGSNLSLRSEKLLCCVLVCVCICAVWNPNLNQVHFIPSVALTYLDALQNLQKWKSWRKLEASESLALFQPAGHSLPWKLSPEFQPCRSLLSPGQRTVIQQTPAACWVGFCHQLWPVQRRRMDTPCCLTAAAPATSYLCSELLRATSALRPLLRAPWGISLITLPPPDMCRALLGRNAEQQYLHTGLLIFTRGSWIFSSS